MQDLEWVKAVKLEELPDRYQALACEIGVEAALKLCASVGGNSIYVPHVFSARSTLKDGKPHARSNTITQLVNGIGKEATLKLCEVYSCETLYVPKITDAYILLVRNPEIAKRYREGERVKSLAEQYKICDRTVLRIVDSTHTLRSPTKAYKA